MKVIGIADFCKKTGLKRARVYRWCREGRLKSIKSKGKLRITFDEEKWLDQNLMRTKRKKELVKLCLGLEKSVKFLHKLITEQTIEEQILNEKLNKR